jgi:hypothetical protein
MMNMQVTGMLTEGLKASAEVLSEHRDRIQLLELETQRTIEASNAFERRYSRAMELILRLLAGRQHEHGKVADEVQELKKEYLAGLRETTRGLGAIEPVL